MRTKKEEVSVLGVMQQLDNVQLVPIEAKFDGEPINHSKIGTANVDENELLGVFEDDYHLIRHEDVMDKVSKHFGDTFQGNYFIGDYCKKLAVYIYPDHMRQLVRNEKEDTEEWIDFGMRISNSYDGSSALRVSSVAFREVCSNGMWAETWMDRSWQRHSYSVQLQELDKTIMKILDADFEDIIMTYEEAVEEQVKSTPVLLRELWGKKHKRMQKEIISSVGTESTKWEIYNQATRYITHHGEGANSKVESTLERNHKDANEILEADLNKIDWSQDVTLMGEK